MRAGRAFAQPFESTVFLHRTEPAAGAPGI